MGLLGGYSGLAEAPKRAPLYRSEIVYYVPRSVWRHSMSSTEKATPASVCPAAVAVCYRSRERLRPRSQTIPIFASPISPPHKHVRKKLAPSTGVRLAQRSPRPSFIKCKCRDHSPNRKAPTPRGGNMASATLLVRANPDGRPSSLLLQPFASGVRHPNRRHRLLLAVASDVAD